MLRVLIADDENAARAKLRRLLARHQDLAIVGEARDGRETAARIGELAPDLVFLDIRMPELDGFAALRAATGSGAPQPLVVFVTAYDEHAVEAFEVRALDYLLKPYDGERLDASLARARAQLELSRRLDAGAVHQLLAQLRDAGEASDVDADAAPAYLERLCIRSPGRVQFVRLADVEWVEACGNYVRLHGAEGRPLARETIRNLASRLDPARFARIHRSAIVNLGAVRELKPLAAGDSLLRLASGARLRVSRAYRPELDRALGRRDS